MRANKEWINLRRFNQVDLKIIEKWYSMKNHLSYATGNKSFSEINEMLFDPNRKNKLILMIETDNDKKTIGFIFGEFKNIQNTFVLWINIFIIDPVFQNLGLGTCAINKLLNFIKAHNGSMSCFVAVSGENPRGLSFWEKNGFTHSSDLEECLNQNGSSCVAILKKEIK